MLAEEIEAFGQRIGLPGLALNDKSVAGLTIAGLGELTLERVAGDAGDELLLVLAAETQPVAPDLSKLLQAASWERAGAPQAGLVHGRAVLALRFACDRVVAADLENGLRRLLNDIERLR